MEYHYIRRFMETLPIRKISGIGKVTEKILTHFEIRNGLDVIQHRAKINYLFSNSEIMSTWLFRAALGVQSEHKAEPRKSMSTERTFPATNDKAQLFEICYTLAQSLSKSMQKVRSRLLCSGKKSINVCLPYLGIVERKALNIETQVL